MAPVIEEAAAQLHRLLLAIPMLADDHPYPLRQLAEAVGTDVTTLARDLRTLVTRVDEGPPGWSEGVRLLFDREAVQLSSHHFRRPMGLSRAEWRALELGLAMLDQELPVDEQAVARSARQRIRQIVTRVAASDGDHTPTRGGQLAHEVETRRIAHAAATIRHAIRRQRVITMFYRSASSGSERERTVHPYGLLFARGHWFLIAFCEIAEAIRVFRVDRIAELTIGDTPVMPPGSGFALEKAVTDGRVFLSDHPGDRDRELLRVRYTPTIARWLHEREGGELEPDGSLVRVYPLADDEWAVRHVLQYGPDAEVLGPQRVREAVMKRLEGLAR